MASIAGGTGGRPFAEAVSYIATSSDWNASSNMSERWARKNANKAPVRASLFVIICSAGMRSTGGVQNDGAAMAVLVPADHTSRHASGPTLSAPSSTGSASHAAVASAGGARRADYLIGALGGTDARMPGQRRIHARTTRADPSALMAGSGPRTTASLSF